MGMENQKMCPVKMMADAAIWRGFLLPGESLNEVRFTFLARGPEPEK